MKNAERVIVHKREHRDSIARVDGTRNEHEDRPLSDAATAYVPRQRRQFSQQVLAAIRQLPPVLQEIAVMKVYAGTRIISSRFAVTLLFLLRILLPLGKHEPLNPTERLCICLCLV